MKRAIATLLTATMLATTVPAWADPPKATVVTPPPPSTAAPTPPPVIFPLTKGQPSPLTGVLFSPEAVAQIIAQRDTAATAAQLAVQHQQELDAAAQKYALDSQQSTCDADKKVLGAQVLDLQNQNKILQDQLKKETSGPGAPVWIGVGVVGGVVLTVVTAFAITRATH
jgi:hypothetical protein